MDLVSGFPKNLAYTLKKLENFTKQTVKVLPDRVNAVQFGEVSRFKLPAGALIDFRTISIFADVSLQNSANYALHLPRNTASLIQQITITCNGVQLCNINDYNLLFNTLYDLEGADFSQTSKRFLENADPSLFNVSGDTIAAGDTTIKAYNAMKKMLVITLKLNALLLSIISLVLFRPLSTPVLDLDDTEIL
jgi:hypothetical protein